MDLPSDVVFQREWEQKLIYATKLIESVMLDAYSNGLKQSDRLFLAKCL